MFKEQQSEVLAAGIDDLVRKPFRFSEIYDCLARQLNVVFIYSTGTAADQTKQNELTPQLMALLPEKLRDELKQVLESLDVQRISAIVQQTGDFSPELKQILFRLADSYNYPQILAVLSKLESHR